MMTLTFDEISQLKKHLENENSGCILHTHDGCGGQYFTLEGTAEDQKLALEKAAEYFASKDLKIISDSRGFRIAR